MLYGILSCKIHTICLTEVLLKLSLTDHFIGLLLIKETLIFYNNLACGPTPDVPNADVLPGLHTLGAKRKYVCHHGLVADGPPKIKCLKGAKWSPVKFKCVGMYICKLEKNMLDWFPRNL